MAEKKNLYPSLVIHNNANPSKLLAFPFVGILIKTILLIPIFIESVILAFPYLFFWLLTPFAILFTGKYWDTAYDFFLGYWKFNTKISLYYFGLTDKYPGFGLDDNGVFTLKIEKPKAPSRTLSFPILGFLVRSILLIPYGLFAAILGYGGYVAAFLSWFFVLFTGKYPESLYEFLRDATRIGLANQMYTSYLSDSYPSFYMSMKNRNIKILLIIAGTLLILLRIGSAFNGVKNPQRQNYQNNQYDYLNK